MTGIPYGANGLMISLREDHDDPQYGDCSLCSPVPDWDRWQRGCPTTDLPAAPLWRARSTARAVDPLAQARHAVTDLRQRQAAHDPPGVELDRAQQLTRWHTDDHVELQQHEHQALNADGGAR
ncbi:MAG: hypothetical protein ACRDS9_17030 [Pseudonocardiaceae bacterium]